MGDVTVSTSPLLDAARGYLSEGFRVVPVPAGQKAPALAGWPELRIEESDLACYFNGTAGNIGVLLGEPSGAVVDVDLDCDEAVTIASRFLPATDRVHGRPGRPSSHFWYRAPGLRSRKYQDPEQRGDAGMIVELRSTGLQTVVPPSVHPSGEPYTWMDRGPPVEVDAHALELAVAKMATAVLLARRWPAEGLRDEAALAVSGVLTRGGWTEEQVDELLEVVAQLAHDPEWRARRKGRGSAARADAGRPVYGWPTFAKLLGEKTVGILREWLGLPGGEATRASPLDFEALIGRVRVINKEDASAGPRFLEDQGVLALLTRASPAQVDVFRRELKKAAGIRGVSVDEALETHRARPEQVEEVEQDPEIAAEAEELLGDPDLLARFTASVRGRGLVGEELAARAVLLASVTRKSRRAIHVVVKSASAGGKNTLVRAVTDHLPPAEVLEISDMTPRALQYLAGKGLKGTVLVLIEQDAGDRAETPIRIAMSEGKLTTLAPSKDPATGEIVTKQYVMEAGCIFSTTTRASLNDENETRVLEITLDESPEQTRRINEEIARRAANPASAQEEAEQARELEVWRVALGLLEPAEVIVADAPRLVGKIPSSRIRARRDFQRLLDLIKGSALLHQRQREWRKGLVVATDQDVQVALELAAGLIDPVPPRLLSIYNRLLAEFGLEVFTATEAATTLGYHVRATRKNLHAIADLELAEEVEEGKGRRPSKWKLLARPDPLSALDGSSGSSPGDPTTETGHGDSDGGIALEGLCRPCGPVPLDEEGMKMIEAAAELLGAEIVSTVPLTTAPAAAVDTVPEAAPAAPARKPAAPIPGLLELLPAPGADGLFLYDLAERLGKSVDVVQKACLALRAEGLAEQVTSGGRGPYCWRRLTG